MEQKYDVFISYRRATGLDCAVWLNAELTRNGFHPYLDVGEYRDGEFPQHIKDALAQAASVIVLLTPGALDFYTNKQDFVLEEIRDAIELKKKIIPIFKPEFQYPDHLPKEIEAFSSINGLPLYDYFRDKTIEVLLSAMRKPTDDIAAPGPKTAAPAQARKVQLFGVAMHSENYTYAGTHFDHVSDDLRLSAVVERSSQSLLLLNLDTSTLLGVIPQLRRKGLLGSTPVDWSSCRLVYSLRSRYVYVLHGNTARIFDIQENRWALDKDIPLPFEANRSWDTAIPMADGTLVLLDEERGMLYTVIRLLPSGQIQKFSMKSKEIGTILGYDMINQKLTLAFGSTSGKLTLMYAEGDTLFTYQPAEGWETAAPISNSFNAHSTCWYVPTHNGVAHYVDFYRSSTGQHLHRIVPSDKAKIGFTPDHRAIWYDRGVGKLHETDIFHQRDTIIGDEAYFRSQEAFFYQKPVIGQYLPAANVLAFLAISPGDSQQFRLVITDLKGQVICTSTAKEIPSDWQNVSMIDEENRLCICFQLPAENGRTRTQLFIGSIS